MFSIDPWDLKAWERRPPNESPNGPGNGECQNSPHSRNGELPFGECHECGSCLKFRRFHDLLEIFCLRRGFHEDIKRLLGINHASSWPLLVRLFVAKCTFSTGVGIHLDDLRKLNTSMNSTRGCFGCITVPSGKLTYCWWKKSRTTTWDV